MKSAVSLLIVTLAAGALIADPAPAPDRWSRDPVDVRIEFLSPDCTGRLDADKMKVVTVVVVGSELLDVAAIDPESVDLAGLTPLRSYRRDLLIDSDADRKGFELESCLRSGADGNMDLVFEFDAREVMAYLGVFEGGYGALSLTGKFYGGTFFEGWDGLVVTKQKPPAHREVDCLRGLANVAYEGEQVRGFVFRCHEANCGGPPCKRFHSRQGGTLRVWCDCQAGLGEPIECHMVGIRSGKNVSVACEGICDAGNECTREKLTQGPRRGPRQFHVDRETCECLPIGLPP